MATAISALRASTFIDAVARVVKKESLRLITCKFYVGVKAKAESLTQTVDREPQMLNTMFYILAQPTLAP